MNDIPACNLPGLTEQIDRLNKRAAKLGCQPLELRILREYVAEQTHTITGLKSQQKRVEIELIGETPKFDGWSLLAAVEQQPSGENLVRTVPGRTVPESYRHTDAHCDHCNTDRRRKEVFILGHEDGRFVQVGRSCIADFLGHVSAETLAARAEWEFSAIDAAREAESDCFGSEHFEGIDSFLGTVAICIRRLGWKSRKMVEAANSPEMTTAAIAWMICCDYRNKLVQEMVREHRLYAEERDETLAKEALEWARTLVGGNDYEHNLGVACRLDYVKLSTTGIVASAISAYLRHKERQEELHRKRAVRTHVGEIGKRQSFANCEIKAVKYFESAYGVRTLVRFECDNNVLIWWASRELDWEVGDKLDIKGTVTKHSDYNGCPQTELKRVVEEVKV